MNLEATFYNENQMQKLHIRIGVEIRNDHGLTAGHGLLRSPLLKAFRNR